MTQQQNLADVQNRAALALAEAQVVRAMNVWLQKCGYMGIYFEVFLPTRKCSFPLTPKASDSPDTRAIAWWCLKRDIHLGKLLDARVENGQTVFTVSVSR